MSVISANSGVPVSVKCRIGVDDHDSYNELCDFIYKVSSTSPTKNFIIHSRKALLNGISPADNRKIPPLKYEFYYALLHDFPDLEFTINGGINSVDVVNAALSTGAHGVMVGRAAYQNPWHTLGHVDTAITGAPCSSVTQRQVLEKYQVYVDSVLGKDGNNKLSARDLVKIYQCMQKSMGEKFFPCILDVATFTRSLEMVCGNEKSVLLSAIARYGSPWNKLQLGSVFSTRYFLLTITSLLEKTLVAIPDCFLDSSLTEAPSGLLRIGKKYCLLLMLWKRRQSHHVLHLYLS